MLTFWADLTGYHFAESMTLNRMQRAAIVFAPLQNATLQSRRRNSNCLFASDQCNPTNPQNNNKVSFINGADISSTWLRLFLMIRDCRNELSPCVGGNCVKYCASRLKARRLVGFMIRPHASTSLREFHFRKMMTMGSGSLIIIGGSNYDNYDNKNNSDSTRFSTTSAT